MCGAPVQGQTLPAGVDASKETVITGRVLAADGQPVGRVGVFEQPDRALLKHFGGTLFAADGAQPIADPLVRQGFLEESNVNPVLEIARMIEVQRAYELGQSFLDGEDQRIRAAIAATTP